MNWDEWKKEAKENIGTQFKDLSLLTKLQKEEIIGKVVNGEKIEGLFDNYIAKERKKPVEQRKFYLDDYGGTCYTVQFPKRSFLEVSQKICSEPTKFTQKNGTIGWSWWGIRIPLLKNFNNDDRIPIATMFMPDDWAEKKDEGIRWEPEDETIFVILRGTNSIQYKWLNDAKTKDGRYENKFVDEAQKKFDNPEIKSIDDILQNSIYKSSMGFLNIKLNPNQILKVI